ncbi:uncharacterized protein LOC125490154 [Plutella xylostella]|uniref:uncharacterized protein LOC125490154 n=1 Tax=Plutella xylostella TaxID=51655 RepID=UPI0020329126|nr:uncharacterized protein LOC125490154 [Plutella xylostella]
MRWCCLVAMMALMSPSLGLQLQKIENNPGILPVRQGTAVIQQDNWLIFKVLDLNGLLMELEYNNRKYSNFSKLVSVDKPYFNEFLGIREQVEYLQKITIDKFKQIIPSHRVRRGILNPIGSIIKVITGNLDQEDAQHYEQLISNLNNQQISTNKRLTVVSKMIDGLINSSEILHNNSKIMDNRLKRIEIMLKEISTKENNAVYSTYILSLYNLFVSNFRTLYIKISELETALAFTKINIVHQSILNSTDLLQLLINISKSENLMYTPTLENLVKIEDTINVKSYMIDRKITFVLEIPLIANSTYNYYKMYPLPIFHDPENLTLVIIPKYPYILVRGVTYLPLIQPCKQVSEENYLCTHENRAPYPEITCTEELMTFKEHPTHCNQNAVIIEQIKVQKISINKWILYSRNTTIIEKRCNSEISRNSIKGTYIILIDEPCDLYINNMQLHHQRSYTENMSSERIPSIKLPELQTRVNSKENENPVNLQGMDLSDLQHMSYMLKQLNSESDSEMGNSVKVKSISLGTLLLYFIVFLMIFVFILKNRKKLTNMLQWRNHRDVHVQPPDNFALKEGGVMYPQVSHP